MLYIEPGWVPQNIFAYMAALLHTELVSFNGPVSTSNLCILSGVSVCVHLRQAL